MERSETPERSLGQGEEHSMDSEDAEGLLVALGIGHFDRGGQYHDCNTYDPDLMRENEEFVERFWDQANQDLSD
jgi:hypothetical protein